MLLHRPYVFPLEKNLFFSIIIHGVHTYDICTPTNSYTPNPILHSKIELGVAETSFPCIIYKEERKSIQ